MSDITLITIVVVQSALIAVFGLVTLALARQVGVLLERVAPAGALTINKVIKAGERAPQLLLRSLQGEPVQIGDAGGRGQLLFFLSPGCPVCKTLLPVLKTISRQERQWLDVILASDGDAGEHRAFIDKFDLGAFPYLLSDTLGLRFGVAKLPYAVLVDGDGSVAALGLVNNREHLESLFEARARGIVSIQEYMDRQAQQQSSVVRSHSA